MEWDKLRMAQRFLQKANAIHPDEAEGDVAHDKALALQDVYYDCYMSSFSRQDLVKRLGEIIGGDIQVPEDEEVDEDIYLAEYVIQARVILSSIEQGEYQ